MLAISNILAKGLETTAIFQCTDKPFLTEYFCHLPSHTNIGGPFHWMLVPRQGYLVWLGSLAHSCLGDAIEVRYYLFTLDGIDHYLRYTQDLDQYELIEVSAAELLTKANWLMLPEEVER